MFLYPNFSLSDFDFCLHTLSTNLEQFTILTACSSLRSTEMPSSTMFCLFGTVIQCMSELKLTDDDFWLLVQVCIISLVPHHSLTSSKCSHLPMYFTQNLFSAEEGRQGGFTYVQYLQGNVITKTVHLPIPAKLTSQKEESLLQLKMNTVLS